MPASYGIRYPEDIRILNTTTQQELEDSILVGMQGAQPSKIPGTLLTTLFSSGENIAHLSVYGTGPGQVFTFSPAFVPVAFVGIRQDGLFFYWSSNFPVTTNGIYVLSSSAGTTPNCIASVASGSITCGSSSVFCFSGYLINLVIFGG